MSVNAYQLTPLAEADLEEIWLYTFQTWSQDQANNYYNDLIAAFNGLTTGSKQGRTVDIRPSYLKYAVGSHMVYYRKIDSVIIITRILHNRMDVDRHL